MLVHINCLDKLLQYIQAFNNVLHHAPLPVLAYSYRITKIVLYSSSYEPGFAMTPEKVCEGLERCDPHQTTFNLKALPGTPW